MFSIGANIKSKIIKINKVDVCKEEFVNLIQKNKISMYRFAISILKNESDAEDAISEAIFKAYKNINKLKDIDSFKPWIMQIVANESYSIIKKNKRLELVDNIHSLNLIHEDKEYSNLREIVESLNEEYSSIIVLFYYEDMSIKDISKVLDIPQGTVKSRLSRAKSKLSVLLKEEV